MSVVNQTVMELSRQLSNPGGKEKMAQDGGDWIRDRLREVSFFRHLVPPRDVTREECQVSLKHDTLVKIEMVEPESRAMAVSFRGETDARVIHAPRFAIPFWTVMSERFNKTEQELQSYTAPVTKIIEDNSIKDLQEIEDREGLRFTEAACQALQAELNATGVKHNATTVNAGTSKTASVVKGSLALAQNGTDFAAHAAQRPDFVSLFKLLDNRRLRSERILLTEGDADDILTWTVEDFGDKIQSETVVDGYTYNTLLGRKVVRTIKSDILRPGNVYVFTAPEFFGKFYILNRTKFYIDKIGNRIIWWCWEDIGIGIGNVAAVAKLELFRGSVRPADEDTGYAALQPKAEEDLGAANNRVDAGTYYPAAQLY